MSEIVVRDRSLLKFVNELSAAKSDQAEAVEWDRRTKHLKYQIALHNIIVVGYFDEHEKGVIEEVSEAVLSLPDVTRLIITEEKIAERMNIPFRSLVLYQSDKDPSIYEGPLNRADIKKWILLEQLPLIVPYTAENTRKIFNKEHGVDVQLLFFAPTENPSKSILEATDVMQRIAQKYRYRVIIIQIPAENPRLLDFYGIEQKDVPAVVLTLEEGNKPRKYRLSDRITDVSVSYFLDQGMNGNLEPYLRSEKKPNHFVGPVYVVSVGRIHL